MAGPITPEQWPEGVPEKFRKQQKIWTKGVPQKKEFVTKKMEKTALLPLNNRFFFVLCQRSKVSGRTLAVKLT